MEEEEEKEEPKIELKNYRTDSLLKKKVKIEDDDGDEINNRINKSGTMVKKRNFKISDSIKMRANLFEKKGKK